MSGHILVKVPCWPLSHQTSTFTMRRRAVPATSSSSDSDSDPASSPSDNAAQKVDEEDNARFSLLDLLQILGGLVLLSSVLSFFITNSSFTWNFRPAWTRSGVVKAWLVFLSAFSLSVSLCLPRFLRTYMCIYI